MPKRQSQEVMVPFLSELYRVLEIVEELPEKATLRDAQLALLAVAAQTLLAIHLVTGENIKRISKNNPYRVKKRRHTK